MKVVITEAAEVDLERIGDAFAHALPRRAVSFIAELRESCESLGDMPEAFPLVPGPHKSGIRRRVRQIFDLLQGCTRPDRSASHTAWRNGL